MASTTNYGFPLEIESEPPGHTLRADDSFSPTTLGEAVDAEIARVDADLADVQEAVARGWETIHVDKNVTGVTTFAISPGVYDEIYVTMRGSLDAIGQLNLRVNGDTTSNLHRRKRRTTQPDGTVVGSDDDEGTVWILATWGTSVNNVCEFRIFDTDASNRISMQGFGSRFSLSSTTREDTIFAGELDDERLLSSLRFGVLGSDDFDIAKIKIEGHRI